MSPSKKLPRLNNIPPLFETLEERLLLTTIEAGDYFIYNNAAGDNVRVTLSGYGTAELLAMEVVDGVQHIVDLVGILNGNQAAAVNWPEGIWGEGKRSGWLTSFTLACIDEDGNLLEIGKVGTGIKEKDADVTFESLTELLKPLIIAEKGKSVKIRPKIVVEVTYEEIQKSPTYTSGYALRFPRVLRLREDRSPDDASTIEMVEDFYHGQKGK